MDPNSDEEIFLSHFTHNKANRVLNHCTKTMMNSKNWVVDDIPEKKEEFLDEKDDVPPRGNNVIDDDGQGIDVSACVPDIKSDIEKNESSPEYPLESKGPSIRIQKMHPQDSIIGNSHEGVTIRSSKHIANFFPISKVKPRNVKEALIDEYRINALQKKKGKVKRFEVWDLAPRPERINVIET